jgi:hypothetical protein
MVAPKLSELDMLTQLLDSGKLALEESERARGMYCDLISGRVPKLSQESHVWVHRLFYEHRVGGQPPRRVSKDRKAQTKELFAAFEAMPRPKKPPGRS